MQYPGSSKNMHVLVAPLDWGMGHAARCIPIINQLLANNCQVWIAGEGDTLLLLQTEFPNLSSVRLPGYNVSYQKAKRNFSLKLLSQIPKIMRAIRSENKWLSHFLQEQSIDLVISDNRFGLYTHKAHTVFITHQLAIKTGVGSWVDKIVTVFNRNFIKKFNDCWIPDYPGDHNLAGDLSHPPYLPTNGQYIGALSRFEKGMVESIYKLVIVLSGPEPARTDFEKMLLEQLSDFEGRVLLVRGSTAPAPPVAKEDLTMVDLMAAEALNHALSAAEFVICRSGYTSVMDLVLLQKKAILIPTPGQPEQEYLARRLHHNKILYCIPQRNFYLNQVLKEAESFPYCFSNLENTSRYKKFVNDLIKTLQSK